MSFPNPFARQGQWFKGCLHVHSTASDGKLTPQQVYDWYRNRGYHFLALTDHSVPSEVLSVECEFITLGGIEVEGQDPRSGKYHLVGLGTDRPPYLGGGQNLPLQEAVNRLRAAGALVCLAHPYWSGQMSGDLLRLAGCFALEIYNGGCEVDDAKGFSTVHWDDLLAAGRRLWGLAVDDAHWRDGSKDAGLGWVWVKAPTLGRQSILSALEAGYFYSSMGPKIRSVRFDQRQFCVHVECSPAVLIDFVGNGSASTRVMAASGRTFTRASCHLRRGQQYVRLACQDGQGCWAWSNPLFLDPVE